jgi:prepilin-type N-terminal cleavage/methylation domain-containing protein
MNERGWTLVELLVVMAIIAVIVAVAAPGLLAYSEEAQLLGAGQKFRSEFLLGRSIAARLNTYAAIRFETREGQPYFALYADGNHNGVRSVDIEDGVDTRVSGPFPLTAGGLRVRVGINPGTPAIPPEHGDLDPDDPIRFEANMLSFSPNGTATPGTFYLAGEHAQAAVRVNAGSARVRLLICHGDHWVER